MSSQAILNPENQGLILIKHSKEIDELKIDIKTAVKLAGHSKEIAEQHKLEIAKEFGLLKKDFDVIEKSIRKIEDQVSGIVDEKTVLKMFEHFEDVRMKQEANADKALCKKNDQLKIWMSLICIIIAGALSWVGTSIKGSIDRQNTAFIMQLEKTMQGDR